LIPQIECKYYGKGNDEIHDGWGNGEIQRSSIYMLFMKWHATPCWLHKILSVVLNIVHFCKRCPGKSGNNAANPQDEDHSPGPSNSSPWVKSERVTDGLIPWNWVNNIISIDTWKWYLSIVKATIVRIEAYIRASLITTFISHASWKSKKIYEWEGGIYLPLEYCFWVIHLSKYPRILSPHQKQLTWHGKQKRG